MAGIFIHYSNAKQGTNDSLHSLGNVLSAMKANPDQAHKELHLGKAKIGVVAKISQDVNELWYNNPELGITIALDGFCRIAQDFISKLDFRPDSASQREHLKGICQLVANGIHNWVDMLEGSFNIAVYDVKSDQLTIANDIFGFYPLYQTSVSNSIVFSSKLSSILESGVIVDPGFDYVSFAEHLLFNYVISENSFVNGVSIVPAASKIDISKTGFSTEKYLHISDYLKDRSLNSRDSFALFESSLKDACQKIMKYSSATVNMSLTGGWDSRLVLSYLIMDYKDRLRLYSFGAEQSPDITVPQEISSSEALEYTPIILNENYLRESFKKAAHQTVMLSEGTRNYKRSHYLYAIQKVAKVSIDLMTGIFGDEVIKVGRPQGGGVISKNTVRLLETGFIPDAIVQTEMEAVSIFLSRLYDLDSASILRELLKRIEMISGAYQKYGNSSAQHLVFRFEINLRKYFGAEAASYNDFVNCYSPFTDRLFFLDYLKTSYASFRHPFVSSNMWLKMVSARLYALLVAKQYTPLLEYPSSRGYSMKKALSYRGYLSIALFKCFRKRSIDAFSTAKTSAIFEEVMKEKGLSISNLAGISAYKEDLYSLVYWAKHIQDKHLKRSPQKMNNRGT